MSKSRLFLIVGLVAIFACGQLALAQVPHNWRVKVIPNTHSSIQGFNPSPETPPKAGLYAVGQWFGATSYPILDSGDLDLWPCFGSTTSPSPDCADIISGGVVVGNPAYVWPLAAPTYPSTQFGCAATTTADASNYCGQTETWYEDWTADSADDLVYEIVVTQVQNGATVDIVNSGVVDFNIPGNPYASLVPAGDVIIYGDQNFGTWGMTGKNNGNCTANYNYPGTGGAIPVSTFIVAANKICSDPVPGLATLSATTLVETPKWTCSTKTGLCTVKLTKKYSVAQKWTIFFYDYPE